MGLATTGFAFGFAAADFFLAAAAAGFAAGFVSAAAANASVPAATQATKEKARRREAGMARFYAWPRRPHNRLDQADVGAGGITWKPSSCTSLTR
jgi:hypothetical protein